MRPQQEEQVDRIRIERDIAQCADDEQSVAAQAFEFFILAVVVLEGL